MKILLQDIEMVRDAHNAVKAGHTGIAAAGKDYEICDRLAGAGMLEYVGECEIVDDDGHMTGHCAACFAPTSDGRTLLADCYGDALANTEVTDAKRSVE